MGNKLHAALLAAFVAVSAGISTVGCGPSSGATLQPTTSSPDDHQTAGSNPTNQPSSGNSTENTGGTQPPAPVALNSFHPAAVAFWDDQNGLMGGMMGSPGNNGTSAKGVIEATHDGGKTWEKLSDTDSPVFAIAVEGKNMAWATISIDGQSKQWMVSSDGGKTWSKTDANGKSFTPPHFVATPASNPAQGQWPQLQFMSFATNEAGWALCTGQPGAGSQGKALYRTTDGGRSWTPVLQISGSSGMAGGLSMSGYPTGIFFLPSGEGFLWEQRGGFYRTNDGGKNWNGLPIAHPESFEARAVWFTSDQAGYGLFWNTEKSDTELMKTANAGDDWTLVSSFTNG